VSQETVIDARPARRRARPDPDTIRARCPCCDGIVVSQLVYTRGKGYFVTWQCWEAMGPRPTCNYKRVL